MESRKQDIIIQLGGEWIRVGLVGDKTPRKTIAAGDLAVYRSDIPQQQYEIKIQQILYTMFYTHINSSCLNKTVILMEKVFTDRRILQAIAKILFKKFKIQRLEFSLSCITPLYLTGRFSGLVVSAGASCVQIMPVYESYPLFKHFKYIPSGTQSIIKQIKDQLLLLNPDMPQQARQRLTPQYLSQIRNLHSNMHLVESQSQQPVQLTIKRSKVKLIPSNINYSNLFGNPENQQYNMAYMLLESLNSIPHSMLDAIAGNIVLVGGLWRVKGMQVYFKHKIKQFIPNENFKKLQNHKISDKLKFVSWGFNPAEVSWIGCSVGASVKTVDALCLKKVEYDNDGFTQKIMANYFLSN